MSGKIVKGELTPNEKLLFECINSKDVAKFDVLISDTDSVRIGCLDKSGMTPLQHACFKADSEMVNKLLKRGACVNGTSHDSGYSALMFGCLSGNVDVVTTLLAAGADVDHKNDIGKTASQMAAFCGQHHIVSVVNSFFSRRELDYYTIPRGFETQGKLKKELVIPLHDYIVNATNLHPVQLCKRLLALHNSDLLGNHSSVVKVLDLVVKSRIASENLDEVFALKLHYLTEVLRLAGQEFDKGDEDLTKLTKKLITGDAQTGFVTFHERLVRQALKTFPNYELQLPRYLLKQVAVTPVGNEPSAIGLLMQVIHGQHWSDKNSTSCGACGKFDAPKECSSCTCANYCDAVCQRIHWFTHKKHCARLLDMKKQLVKQQRQEQREMILKSQRRKQEAAEGDSDARPEKGQGDGPGDSGTDLSVEDVHISQ